jgi:alpha-galactosidase
MEELKIDRPKRREIKTEVSGINHFTWISKAMYKDIDILTLLPAFMEKYFESGYCANNTDILYHKHSDDPFVYGNRVKMDLYRRFGVLGGAGDRHLAEFMNNSWYMKSPSDVTNWGFKLTPVSLRKQRQKEQILRSYNLANGIEEIKINKSSEEAVDLLKSILGFGDIVSNVNMPNRGQIDYLPEGSIVESNCEFSKNSIKPIAAKSLPKEVENLIIRNCINIDVTYQGIKERNLSKIFEAFINQPLCSVLSYNDGRKLFKEMINNAKKYLEDYYDINSFRI